MESILPDIALTLHPNIGCRTIVNLLETFGSAHAIYEAGKEELIGKAHIDDKLAASIHKRETFPLAQREYQFASHRKINVLRSTDPAYPQRLLTCEDYPHILYVAGHLDFNNSRWLAIVGTRKITEYGMRAVEFLVGELSEMVPDLVIVSGLAYGADIAAHRAAVKYGIPTIGVLGQSLDHIYPTEHTDFARTMVRQGGAVISEFPTVIRTYKSAFVQRNRVIAGITDGTLIIESPGKGGSLITADLADGYHRTVMAVPGRINDPNCAGTNRLIRSMKAQLVSTGRDILDSMGWQDGESDKNEKHPPVRKIQISETSFEAPAYALEVGRSDSAEGSDVHSRGSAEKIVSSSMPSCDTTDEPPEETLCSSEVAIPKILQIIEKKSPVFIDELCLLTHLPFHELSVILMELELSGEIRSLPGKLYVKN